MKETVEPQGVTEVALEQETEVEPQKVTALEQVEVALEQVTEAEPRKVMVPVQVEQVQVEQDRRAFHEHS